LLCYEYGVPARLGTCPGLTWVSVLGSLGGVQPPVMLLCGKGKCFSLKFKLLVHLHLLGCIYWRDLAWALRAGVTSIGFEVLFI
jgi:hypothetical protein